MRYEQVCNRFVTAVAVVIVLVGLWGRQASAQLQAPLVNTASPPTINGTIATMEWEDAGATARVFSCPGTDCLQDFGGVNRDVTVYALHDNNNLYLAFVVNDETRYDLPSILSDDDGVILLFHTTPTIAGGIVAGNDISFSYFVYPNAATPDLDDFQRTGNTHTPSPGGWITMAGLPDGMITAEFFGMNEQGWHMEIVIPFSKLNGIDPNTAGSLGFAFFIINDYGDTDISGTSEGPLDDDDDGFLAFPPGLAGTLTVPTPLISASNTLDDLLGGPQFTNPSTWSAIQFERPDLLVVPEALDFGLVRVGETGVIGFNVTNNVVAGPDLTYTLPVLGAPFSYNLSIGSPTGGSPAPPMAAGATQPYEIHCAPTVEGVVPTATETITSNDVFVDLTLDCEGGLPHLGISGPPQLTDDTPPNLSIDFGTLDVGRSEFVPINISNSGGFPLDVQSISAVSGSPDITITAPATGQLLGIVNGAPQSIIVRCEPSGVGLRSASFSFTTTEPSTIDVDDVSCTGVTREVVMLLDASGSMTKNNAAGEPATLEESRWKDLEESVTQFTGELLSYAQGRGTFNAFLFADPFSSDVFGVLGGNTFSVLGGMQNIDEANWVDLGDELESVPRSFAHTPIGSALSVGAAQFSAPNSKRALILFSDGQLNGGVAPETVYSNVRATGAQVYTIGYGLPASESVDRDLLRDIADLSPSAGLIINDVEVKSTFYDVNALDDFALSDAFKRILTDEFGLDLVVDPPGFITANQEITRDVAVSDLNEQLIFNLNWSTYQSNRIDFELLTPECELITPATALTDPRIEYRSGEKFKTYTINDDRVEAGQWQVILRGSPNLTGSEPYTYWLISDSWLRFEPVFDRAAYSPGQSMRIEASLHGAGTPITGATVYFTLDQPQGSIDNWLRLNPVSTQQMALAPDSLLGEPASFYARKSYVLQNVLGIQPPLAIYSDRIYMHDDGVTGGDEVANDGIYSATVSSTQVTGTYDFLFHAEGLTPGGYEFVREALDQRLVRLVFVDDFFVDWTYDYRLLDDRVQALIELTLSGLDPFGNVPVLTGVLDDFEILVDNGSPFGGLIDNGNGTYTQTIIGFDPRVATTVGCAVGGDPVLSTYEAPVVSEMTFVNSVLGYEPGAEGQPGFNLFTNASAATGPLVGGLTSRSFLSLGGKGAVTVSVGGLALYDSTGFDLAVFEVAHDPNRAELPESFSLEAITVDGVVSLGTYPGGTAQVDLADFGVREASAIRIVDRSGTVADHRGKLVRSPGADIQAVGFKYVRAPTEKPREPPEEERPGVVELVPFAGWTVFSDTLSLQNGAVVGARLGFKVGPLVTLEAEGGVTFTETVGGESGNVIQALGNVRVDLTRRGRVDPYVTAGAGYMFFRGFALKDEAFVAHGGVGGTVSLGRTIGLRGDARVLRLADVFDLGATTNFQATLGLVFGIPR